MENNVLGLCFGYKKKGPCAYSVSIFRPNVGVDTENTHTVRHYILQTHGWL